MGRQLRRVKSDFNWPLYEPWKGFLNPHYGGCPDCENGETKGRQILARGIGSIVYSNEKDLEELIKGLTGEKIGRSGAVINKIIKAAGLDPEAWGLCKTCKGEGIDPKYKKAYEAWVSFDPPEGDYYQIWETVSEGSPVSPPFETIEELAKWMARNDCSVTGDMTEADWVEFCKPDKGWAPSFVASKGDICSGAKDIARSE